MPLFRAPGTAAWSHLCQSPPFPCSLASLTMTRMNAQCLLQLGTSTESEVERERGGEKRKGGGGGGLCDLFSVKSVRVLVFFPFPLCLPTSQQHPTIIGRTPSLHPSALPLFATHNMQTQSITHTHTHASKHSTRASREKYHTVFISRYKKIITSHHIGHCITELYIPQPKHDITQHNTT